MQQTSNDGDDQAVLDGIELQRKLAAADAAERERILTEAVREQAASVLELAAFTPDTNFLENGLNSLRALELTQRLTTLTGIEIPLVAVLEHPTPAALGHHMVDTLTEAAG